MDEYVKKSAVIDWFRPYGHTDEPIPFETLVSDLRDSIPPADVAQAVHGMWKSEATRKPFLQMLYKCSKCGYLVDRVSNFCPNCGAKMDGGAS